MLTRIYDKNHQGTASAIVRGIIPLVQVGIGAKKST